MKLLREPLTHFLLIGAAIYLAFGLLNEPTENLQDHSLVVDAGEIEWMATSWYQRWNRMPTAKELDGLIQQYVRETILYREALSMGLDRDDVVIRRRLAQKLEFLAQDLATLTPPSDTELQAYFVEHQDRYGEPARYTFTQIYFDPDKRGDETLADAHAAKATLVSQPDAVGDLDGLGDNFMLQSYYPEYPPMEIRKLFGGGFAESVTGLSPGEWHGPILSGYGTHLVYVHGILEPPEPDFETVRPQVQQDWEAGRRESMNAEFYARLRERYDIVIEMPEEEDRLAVLEEPAQ